MPNSVSSKIQVKPRTVIPSEKLDQRKSFSLSKNKLRLSSLTLPSVSGISTKIMKEPYQNVALWYHYSQQKKRMQQLNLLKQFTAKQGIMEALAVSHFETGKCSTDLFSELSPECKPLQSPFQKKIKKNFGDLDLFIKMSPRLRGVDVLLTFLAGCIGLQFEGNCVTKVFPDTQAQNMGVCVGWQIISVNGQNQPNNATDINIAIDKTCMQGKSTHILFCTNNIYQEDMSAPSLDVTRSPKQLLADENLQRPVSKRLSQWKNSDFGSSQENFKQADMQISSRSSTSKTILAPLTINDSMRNAHLPKTNGVQNPEDLFSHLSTTWKDSNLNCNTSISSTEKNVSISSFDDLKDPSTKIPFIPKRTLVTFQPGPIGIRVEGNQVIAIRPGSQAEHAKIRHGWRIIAVNGKKQPNNMKVIDKAIDETYKANKSTNILFLTNMEEAKSIPPHPQFVNEYSLFNKKKLKYGDNIEYNTIKGWKNGTFLSHNLDGTSEILQSNGKFGHKWKSYNIRQPTKINNPAQASMTLRQQ